MTKEFPMTKNEQRANQKVAFVLSSDFDIHSSFDIRHLSSCLFCAFCVLLWQFLLFVFWLDFAKA